MHESRILSVRGLAVEFPHARGALRAVNGLDLDLDRGETVCVVGESGSGKSVSALAIMRLTDFEGARIVSGSAHLRTKSGAVVDLCKVDRDTARRLRGSEIGMVFQEPMTSLNPVMTIGRQLTEVLSRVERLSAAQAKRAAIELIARVGLSDPPRRFDQYPHELSGGMRQRVMIAMALAARPALLIADEPTTALDVTVQAQVLDLMRDLSRETNTAILFITHDMGVVAQMADRVVVMRHGECVERGTAEQIFHQPTHPYTQALLKAVPVLGSMAGSDGPSPQAEARAETPLLRVDGVSTSYRSRGFWRRKSNPPVVECASFSLAQGETLGVVGESGSGKSTLGKSILRLIEADSGQIVLDGTELRGLDGAQLREARRDMQLIFQDPFSALNPRRTVFEAVAEPLLNFGKPDPELRATVANLLERVGLRAEHLDRFPHEFSGGQRQRICIARALALAPRLIVADEAVSALDVSIRAQVLDLMLELQRERGISYVFISHDMAVVERVSHQVAVMRAGRIVEIGSRRAIFETPQHPYTRQLLAAVPVPDPKRRGARSTAAPVLPPGDAGAPIYRTHAQGHLVATNC